MANSANIIALSAPVAIEAGDAKRVPTFEAVVYTGGAIEVGGWDQPVVLDLLGLTTGNVLVANLEHDTTKRVGNFSAVYDGRTLKARGIASAATEAQREVVESAKRGYTWQASVEVQPKSVEPVKAGDTVSVNGRTATGPVYVTRKGILKGFAFVSHGADDSTSVAIAAKRKGKMATATTFENWLTESGIDATLMTSEQLAGLHANYEGRSGITSADHEAALPMISASADPVDAENRRLRQIEAAVKGEWGEQADTVQELKQRPSAVRCRSTN